MARYQAQLVDLQLERGITQQSESKAVEFDLQTVDNLVYDKRKRLKKRVPTEIYELDDFSTGTLVDGVTRICAQRDGNVVYCTRESVFELSKSTERCSWHGPIPDFGLPRRSVVARDGDVSHNCFAACASNGYQVFAWITDSSGPGYGELWTSVHSSEGVEIFRQKIATTTQRLRLLERKTDAAVILWWMDGGSAPYTLKYATLDTSGTVPGTWGAPVSHTGAVLPFGGERFDVCAIKTTGVQYLAFYNGSNLVMHALDGTSLATLFTATIAEAVTTAIGIETDGATVAVGWSTSTATRGSIRSALSLASVAAPTTLIAASCYTINWAIKWDDATSWVWVVGRFDTFTLSNVVATVFGRFTTSAVTGTDQTVYHVFPVSRPQWVDNGGADQSLVLAVAYYGQALEQSLYIMRYSALASLTPYGVRPVAVLLTGGLAHLAQDKTSGYQTPNELQMVGDTFLFAWGEVFRYTSLAVSDSGYTYAYGLAGTTAWNIPWGAAADLDFNDVELERSVYLSGGIVIQYDGGAATELGWAWSPSIHAVSVGVGTNTWLYVFTYVWYDKQGKLHESRPCPPIKVTAANSTTWDIQTLTLTYRQDATLQLLPPVGIRMYRTLDAGTTFRFVAEIKNRTDLDAVSIVDNNGDNAIAANPTIYTDQRLIPFGFPIAASDVCTWDNRVLAANGERVYLSTRASEANAPCWVDDASHWIETHSGDETIAIEQQDDAIVMFKESRALLVQGEGPEQSGQPILPEPRLIQGALGCVNPRSLVATPMGLAYQSLRGIELLPRGFGQTVWVGEAVRDTFAQFANVRGACVDWEHSRVIWAGVETQLGLVAKFFVLDWSTNAWTTATTMENAPAELQAQDVPANILWSNSDMFDGLVYPLDTPYLRIPSAGVTENDIHLVSTIETNKFRVSGMSGEARLPKIRIVGELAATAARLTIAVAFDDGDYSEGKSWDIQGAIGDTIQREYWPSRQKVQSIRAKITDGAYLDATANAGVILNSLSLVLAAHRGAQPLDAARRG